MPDDLIERLKALAAYHDRGFPVAEEAADALSRLQAENRRLREAVMPFAKESELYPFEDGNNGFGSWGSRLRVGDLRRAAAALKETGTDDDA